MLGGLAGFSFIVKFRYNFGKLFVGGVTFSKAGFKVFVNIYFCFGGIIKVFRYIIKRRFFGILNFFYIRRVWCRK